MNAADDGQAGRPGVPAFHSLSPMAVAQSLGADAERGLSAAEVLRRRAADGPNELQEKPRPSFFSLFLRQFRNFLVLILIAAAIVSIALGEWVNAGAIILIVILNAAIGVVQESRAEEALTALRKMAAPDARVVRDGQIIVVSSRDVVAGDVVLLEAGNRVPADVRLTETVTLLVEEASLTGESVPVEKQAGARLTEAAALGDRCTMAWMSTTVSFGRGRGIVTAIGMRTQIGLIAEMLQESRDEDTPLQKKLTQLGKWLGMAALALCAVVFLVGIIEGRNILMMFLTSVSLAIAAVPEGLPAIVTVCLALGMREMIMRHALIRKLPAVETLGSATVICTDKTGTLTQNTMSASHLWADGEILAITGELEKDGRRAELRTFATARPLLQAAMLASDARIEPVGLAPVGRAADGAGTAGPAAGSPPALPRFRTVGDPTEGALVVAAAKAGLHREKVEAFYPRVAEIPFDAERKRMSTIHRMPEPPCDSRDAAPVRAEGPFVVFVKGAPDLLLERCIRLERRGRVEELDAEERRNILDITASLASRALRVLGAAYRPLAELPRHPVPDEVETGLTFLGLVAMADPARPEAADAIAIAHRAGLKVIMVTGDYAETAAAIGRAIGLVAEGATKGVALSGADIDSLDDAKLGEALERTTVFARVSPQHKVRIVEALKARGHVVGMTGDGVNDAPALKRADIGIAMGITGTDVTRESADMVLTDDNFASIISAVEQGRVIFSNIRKFVYFLTSCNVGEIGTIFLGTLLGWPMPLTAIQLLWMNLVTDGAPALALGLEKGEPGVMDRPPRPTAEPIINRPMILALALQGMALTAVTLLAFWLGWTLFGAVETARTMAFVVLSGCQLVRAYTSRSERASLFSLGVFSNRWMQYATASSAVLILAAVYIPGLNSVFNAVPLSLLQWAYLAPLLLLPGVVDELTKLLQRIMERRGA